MEKVKADLLAHGCFPLDVQIAKLLLAGKSDAEIQKEVGISELKFNFQINRTVEKLGLAGRDKLVPYFQALI